MAQVNGLSFYERDIDAHCGYQIVTVKNGTIEAQSIHSKQRGTYYTGDGNPELVGQPAKALRGMGFKKVDERGGYHTQYQHLVDQYYESGNE